MEKKQGFFEKLKKGLSKTGGGLFASLFSGDERIDADFYDELEEAMIVADMGMATAGTLLEALKNAVSEQKLKTRTEAREVLAGILAGCMRPERAFLPEGEPAVLLIVGVNGVGKTTSIGKMAAHYKSEGRKPMMAAADTFRAAAAEQLSVWAERAGVPIIKHGEGADPAAVVFDAIASFKAKGCDLLLCDTAGRLHNKKNLMSELEKIRRVIARELPGMHTEVLLVLDATTGQNAIAQARVFGESAGLTGVVLTKLDGTAKGGMTVAIKQELGLPVRFVGVGEGIDDLQPFDADAFARALIGA
ncbi:MAG: signal recognition particle-docking protein FtsY [Christensenella sp.]|jgi:fused signal recognition particle receptor|nr:signal recognition particle-docking protein FtsY [Christensenella sp.]